VGILGYGLYSLGMIFFQNMTTFYFLQIILGISASLFFVSSRAILMGSHLENPDRAFAWFYSAPSYADAIAPAVGALFIWKFDFTGVFILSLVLQILNAVFCFTSLRKKTSQLTEKIKIRQVSQNYLKVLGKIKYKNTLPYILVSFLVLILAGFNNTFFALFLKELHWSQNQILIFNSVLSLFFLPLSLWAIKRVARFRSEINICQGSQITGIFSFILGSLVGVLNFYSTFIIMLGSYLGGLMAFAGRSGLMTIKLKEYPEESAAVDTVFSPLATAVGALAGGLIIGPFGYPLIFMLSGILIFFSGVLTKRFAKNENLS